MEILGILLSNFETKHFKLKFFSNFNKNADCLFASAQFSKVKVQFSSKMYFSSERAFTALSNHLAGHMWRMAVEMWRMAVEMWRMAVENVANGC